MSSFLSDNAYSTSIEYGAVFFAETNIDLGEFLSGIGIFEKGLCLIDVHSPLSNKIFEIFSEFRLSEDGILNLFSSDPAISIFSPYSALTSCKESEKSYAPMSHFPERDQTV